jgi:hypothetical protein
MLKRYKSDSKKFKSFIMSVNKVLTWLTFVIIWQKLPVVHAAKPYFDRLTKIAASRGLLAMLAYHKQVRLAVTRYISGSPVRLEGIGSTKAGVPRVLGPLIGYLNCQEHLKWVLTILYSTRGLSFPKEPDIESITSPCKREILLQDFGIKGFWRSLGLYKPLTLSSRKLRFRKYHLTTKAGPNGQALATSVQDLFSIPENLIKDIYVLGGSVLQSKMEEILKSRAWLEKFSRLIPFPLKPGRYRKITCIPDKEDKARVIAILDYWSQVALKPLHEDLYRVLRMIPQDCTFNQGSFQDKLKQPNGKYYSFDLSSATDRFPIDQIVLVLKGRYPSTYIDSWKRVMSGHPFDWNDQQISYSVGNPMGAYSSWASFTLAHHYIVYLSCLREGIDWRNANYVLLGDDIVIGDDRIAKQYLSLIEGLGVEISKQKTHISSDTYEFAKRWVHKGNEISPFPVSAVLDEKTVYTGLLSVLDTIRFRNWSFKMSLSEAIGEFYSIYYHRRAKLRAQIIDKTRISLAVTHYIKGLSDAKEVAKALLQVLNICPDEIHWQGMRNHFLKSVRNSFETSMARIDTIGNPIGKIAESMVMLITDPDLNPACNYELIYSIPLLNVHGQIGEIYGQVCKTLKNLEESKLDWPILLRALTIPLSDDIYVIRERKIPYNAGSLIGRYLIESYSSLYKTFGLSPNELVLTEFDTFGQAGKVLK